MAQIFVWVTFSIESNGSTTNQFMEEVEMSENQYWAFNSDLGSGGYNLANWIQNNLAYKVISAGYRLGKVVNPGIHRSNRKIPVEPNIKIKQPVLKKKEPFIESDNKFNEKLSPNKELFDELGNKMLFDKSGLAYTSHINRKYINSEAAQKAENEQRFIIAIIGILVLVTGALLFLVSPFIGIPIGLIGIIIFWISKQTFEK